MQRERNSSMQPRSVAIASERHDYYSRPLVMDLLALLGFSAAIVVTRGLVKTHMGIPGHSAVYWVPVLILAAARRSGMPFGSALLGGTISMAFCGFRGMEFAGLMGTAAVIETFGIARSGKSRPVRMLLAGTLGHIGKLGVRALVLGVAGVPLNRAGMGLLPTLALYSLFGLIGGVVGLGMLLGWKKLRGEPPTE